MRTKNPISLLKELNSNLANNPFYVTLFEAVNKIIDQQIGEPMNELVRVRRSQHIHRGDYIKTEEGYGKVAHLKRVYSDEGEPLDQITVQLTADGDAISVVRRAIQDRRTLINESRMVGIDYYYDFLSDEDLARIVDYTNTYWPSNGSFDFIKFIGFIKSLSLDMNQLWTKDKGDNATSDNPIISAYDELEPKSDDMLPVWQGGMWYPTSHVEITYDALLSDTLDEDLILLFYSLAPAHLVLERIAGSIDVELGFTYLTVADFQLVSSGYMDLDGI